MAEPVEPSKSDDDKARSVRRVKNPETFRERAVKASEQSAQPSRGGRFKSAASKPANPIVGAVRKAGSSKAGRLTSRPLGLVGRIIFPKYLRNSVRELRLVQWPNGRESRQLTFAVLMFAVVFGVFVALVDLGLDKLFRGVLLK